MAVVVALIFVTVLLALVLLALVLDSLEAGRRATRRLTLMVAELRMHDNWLDLKVKQATSEVAHNERKAREYLRRELGRDDECSPVGSVGIPPGGRRATGDSDASHDPLTISWRGT